MFSYAYSVDKAVAYTFYIDLQHYASNINVFIGITSYEENAISYTISTNNPPDTHL